VRKEFALATEAAGALIYTAGQTAACV
jgi:hypothetical protein